MLRQSNKPLIKQKYFLVTLVLGVLCITASVILFIVVCTHLDSCLSWNACSEESSGYYQFCVDDGYKFCCGGWGGDSDSCGPYINSCRRKNDGFIKCDQIMRAEGILALISMAFLIAVIVIMCLHRRKRTENLAYEQAMRSAQAIAREQRGNQRLLNE